MPSYEYCIQQYFKLEVQTGGKKKKKNVGVGRRKKKSEWIISNATTFNLQLFGKYNGQICTGSHIIIDITTVITKFVNSMRLFHW